MDTFYLRALYKAKRALYVCMVLSMGYDDQSSIVVEVWQCVQQPGNDLVVYLGTQWWLAAIDMSNNETVV